MKQMEKLILKEIKDLPLSSLHEVLDFIKFIKEKGMREDLIDNLNLELSLMDQKELDHLEKEIENYKKIYPKDEDEQRVLSTRV